MPRNTVYAYSIFLEIKVGKGKRLVFDVEQVDGCLAATVKLLLRYTVITCKLMGLVLNCPPRLLDKELGYVLVPYCV